MKLTVAERIYELAVGGISSSDNRLAIDAVFRFVTGNVDAKYQETAACIVHACETREKAFAIGKIERVLKTAECWSFEWLDVSTKS